MGHKNWLFKEIKLFLIFYLFVVNTFWRSKEESAEGSDGTTQGRSITPAGSGNTGRLGTNVG